MIYGDAKEVLNVKFRFLDCYVCQIGDYLSLDGRSEGGSESGDEK